jgi:hypothetical protein
MSIMSRSAVAPNAADQDELCDANLRSLLDHIAVELAEEYVRLMEAAAANEPETATTPEG